MIVMSLLTMDGFDSHQTINRYQLIEWIEMHINFEIGRYTSPPMGSLYIDTNLSK